ncbi:MAG: M23 family metallopeptidase [Actinobacteria bacterium]|nr:M23 family metallopeptidase [Actinomycetota bacterium]
MNARMIAAAAAVMLVAGAASVVSATTSLTLAELATAEPAFEAVGLGYGSRVDEADLTRLAGLLGHDVGQVLDAGDLDHIVALAARRAAATAPPSTGTTTPTITTPAAPTPGAAYAAFEPVFAGLSVGYGNVVDDADLLALARRLGVAVGNVIDAADVDRLLAAGTRATDRFPVFATVGGVTLRQPAEHVELIGYHQSNHEGARDMTALASRTPSTVLPSRGRLSGRRSAADIVAARGAEIRSPVTGTVKRAGTYTLYCRYSDDYAVIEPDEHRGWEVKLLHIDGVRVRAGDRVVAGQTVLAGGPTPLPFTSQVDDHNGTGWPHVHLEVVDLSIPDVKNPGSGGC